MMNPLNTISACTNNCNEISAAFPTYSKILSARSHAAASVQPLHVYTCSFELLSWDPFHLHASKFNSDQNWNCTQLKKSTVSPVFSPLSEFQVEMLTWKCCTATWLQLCTSCGIWHTAPDGANGMGPKIHLPPTANLHLISFLEVSHFSDILWRQNMGFSKM